ncbi:MAG: Succinyl-CoA:coenzyme A transferase [Syntrophaceae bacterium PtaU1.Bin231]|nr:MAG: Succinyl-CoA:coenzyme A transferase [Syntrophaceae bacterium PtaU1.Bin231]
MKASVYADEYRRKLTTPAKAVEAIRDWDTLVHGVAIAEPPALLGAIADRARAGDLKELKIYSFFPMKHALRTVLATDLCDVIRSYTWFVSGADRSLVRVGLNYFVPAYFHQIPKLCREYMKIDAVVTTVSPMDDNGFFSFGTANDLTSTAARSCGRLIVEVNERMPRVFGESLLHISEVDAIVENTAPLMELPAAPAEPEDDAIGETIAAMIPDGATLQLGVGGLPNAVAGRLAGHRDLGIHTELFCPSMADLIERGVVTGAKKTLHPRKNVFTLALGVEKTYAFIDDNPSMESYPVSYTNDPSVIARNDNMISINSILEVDLLGQCNSESLAGFQFSATGGQLDFVRGAFNARGGKSILAFYSTAKGGDVSRVVARLAPGAVVTTPRMDTLKEAEEMYLL